ncbi:hypothetical protein [Archangium lansingense]|uniref:Uncharacterized protein n=1 Tax=Archangium lansingense TaxID=2995310 RepID=A0ABT4AJB5_9BACT|nr:hypothetical protein [Archangium lansinium]MCY1081274.1 hypothetical protein [Archangium lansinium]
MSATTTKTPEQADLLKVAASEKPEREEAKSSARFTSPRPFREWQPEQGQLLPQYAREVLGEGHLACFFVDLRKTLDFSTTLWAPAATGEHTLMAEVGGLSAKMKVEVGLGWKRGLAWGSVGVGAAALAAGGVLFGMSLYDTGKIEERYQNGAAPLPSEAHEVGALRDQVKSTRTWAGVSMGVGVQVLLP